EPWLPDIVVGTAEEPAGLDDEAGHVHDMASRGAHAQRPPPRPVDRQAAYRHHDHAPAFLLRDRYDGMGKAVDAGREGLLSDEPSGFQPQRVVRRVGVP